MTLSVSGMFGEIDRQVQTYFADSPMVIFISGLEWNRPGEAVTSPFTIVRVEVIYNNNVVGNFRLDTGGQTEAHFEISSALKAIWSDFDFGLEVDEERKRQQLRQAAAALRTAQAGRLTKTEYASIALLAVSKILKIESKSQLPLYRGRENNSNFYVTLVGN